MADTVIERALQLGLEEEDDGISMALLKHAPKDEDYRFRQAIQCTICLNSGHFGVDCNMRIHCPICHSQAHTLDQCEYNMLNRLTPTVHRMEPHHRNNNPESDKEDQEEEQYWSNDRYKQGCIDMIIDILPTIAAERPDPGSRHGINVITRKVPRMDCAKSLVENITRNPVITNNFNKH